MITQFFIVGSSLVYGVGATAGWADLLKQHVHAKMYAEDGVGEKFEVYNFGQSGATIAFTKATFPQLIAAYGRKQKVVTIASVGGNNSKAEGRPDNFVSTPQAYEQEIQELLTLLQQHSNKVVLVGSGSVDESKTNPKLNPLTGGYTYFSNKRRREFTEITKQLCAEQGIDFIDVDVPEDEWIQRYAYKDGVHPNEAGHKLIFELVKPVVDAIIA